MSETNYQRYFGTPEKAAKWLADKEICEYCRFYYGCSADDRECEGIMRKWLESEAE